MENQVRDGEAGVVVQECFIVSEREKETSPEQIVVKDVHLSGHVGNLTAEQKKTLYLLWKKVLILHEEIRESRYLQKTPNNRRKSIFRWPFKRSDTSDSLPEPSSKVGNVVRSASGENLSKASQGSPSCVDHRQSEELWLGTLINYTDPDTSLLRCLRARKWNVDDAFTMFHNTFHWRLEFGVMDLMLEGEKAISPDILASNKSFFYGEDKSGHTLIFVLARRHNKNDQSVLDAEKFTVFHMEVARRLLGPGMETVTLVFDMTSAGYASMDMAAVKHMVMCFQAHYPESLHRCYIVNAPWLFWAFWKVISLWLDPVVVSKIKFASREELGKYIDPDVMASVMGENAGPQYVPLEKNETIQNNKMHDENSVAREELREHFVKLRDEFIKLTGLACDQNADTNVHELETRRSAVKSSLVEVASKLNMATFPRTHYDRMGVTDKDCIGRVDWSKCATGEN